MRGRGGISFDIARTVVSGARCHVVGFDIGAFGRHRWSNVASPLLADRDGMWEAQWMEQIDGQLRAPR